MPIKDKGSNHCLMGKKSSFRSQQEDDSEQGHPSMGEKSEETMDQARMGSLYPLDPYGPGETKRQKVGGVWLASGL